MSVTSLSSVDPSTSNASTIFADRRKNMQALNSALQGGDLQAAQSAFAAVQKSLPQGSANVNASSPGGQLAALCGPQTFFSAPPTTCACRA